VSDAAAPPPEGPPDARPPAGDVYDWYRRGLRLLESGDAAAAGEVLAHAAAAAPESSSVREALGRARLGSRRYAQARDDFDRLVHDHPDDDYAHFGLGLALSRLGHWSEAVEQLALACALRPDRDDYARELAHARATWRARAGGDPGRSG
jgi:tetratricopeptide (TPR) repeat protein